MRTALGVKFHMSCGEKGDSMPTNLSDRQRSYLEFHKRYRVSTSEISTSKFCDGSESVAKKLPLSLPDYIASDPLGQKSKYWRLTAAGAKLIGAPEEIAKPPGPQALLKALGILGFCMTGSPTRERYLRHEFQSDFPELAKDLLAKDYHTDFFLDHDGEQARLGQIVVDQGGDFRKLISKCRVKLREYLEVPGLRDIVADGLYTIAFVVAEEEKAQAIRLALKEKPLRARTLVETSSELKKCPFPGVSDGL
jgi:hypothetical protein